MAAIWLPCHSRSGLFDCWGVTALRCLPPIPFDGFIQDGDCTGLCMGHGCVNSKEVMMKTVAGFGGIGVVCGFRAQWGDGTAVAEIDGCARSYKIEVLQVTDMRLTRSP